MSVQHFVGIVVMERVSFNFHIQFVFAQYSGNLRLTKQSGNTVDRFSGKCCIRRIIDRIAIRTFVDNILLIQSSAVDKDSRLRGCTDCVRFLTGHRIGKLPYIVLHTSGARRTVPDTFNFRNRKEAANRVHITRDRICILKWMCETVRGVGVTQKLFIQNTSVDRYHTTGRNRDVVVRRLNFKMLRNSLHRTDFPRTETVFSLRCSRNGDGRDGNISFYNYVLPQLCCG